MNISKDRPKNKFQDIVCYKCKKPGHTRAACYKEQTDEAKSKAEMGRLKKVPKDNIEERISIAV